MSQESRLEEILVTGAKSNFVPSWQTSDSLAPEITVFFPALDSEGQDVVLDTRAQLEGTRQLLAHSADRQEVFTEIVLFAEPIDIDEQFAQYRRGLEQEAAKQSLSVEAPVATFLQGLHAQQSTIQFRQGDTQYLRRVYWLNTTLGGEIRGLRVSMDPRSQLNHEMIEYLEFN